MNRLIIDASVAAKWILPARDEPLVQQAVALLARYRSDEVKFLVPDLFWAELGNLLWNAVRRGRCSTTWAEDAVAIAREYRLATLETEPLLTRAFAIAIAFDRSVYDSIYAALAVESNAQLITADEKLARALAAHLPVRWLGAL